MTTLQTTRAASKSRSFRILRRPNGDTSGRLLLTVGTQTDEYDYLMSPYEDGIAFHLFHESGDETRINTVIITPNGNTCTCKGWEFRSKCKHVSMACVLVSREAQAAPVCSPASETAKSIVCFRCRDSKVIRGNGVVSRCEACDGF